MDLLIWLDIIFTKRRDSMDYAVLLFEPRDITERVYGYLLARQSMLEN
jgi:hypothetical protein